MTKEQRDKLRRLADAFNRGPTGEAETCAKCGRYVQVDELNEWIDGDCCYPCCSDFVHETARLAIPALLDEIERLEKIVAALEHQ